MYQVMIVDDEPKLRTGLKTLIPWESLGYEVAAAAAGGNEALRLLQGNIPDLLIVDIRMPGMDGLQLIQEIRSLGFAPHFLILSGYADFEYARKALEFGADGYLLKPVNKEELTAKLQQLSRKLEQERREDWLKNGTLTKEWLVYSLLTGQLREGEDRLREMAEQAGLLWPCYEIVLVGLDVAEPERAEALLHFRTKLASAFKDGGRGIVFGIAPYTVILNNGPLRSEPDRKRLYRELRMLAGEWSGQMDAAAGGAVAELQRVGQSYKAAETLLERRFFYAPGNLLGPDTPRDFAGIPQTGLRGDRMDEGELAFRLFYFADVGDAGALEPLLASALRQWAAEGAGETEIKQKLFQAANEVIRKVPLELRSQPEHSLEPAAFLSGIYEQRHIRGLFDYVLRFLEKLAMSADDPDQDQEIKRLLDFIHRHYHENLRLEMMAGLFNYSSAYLGQLFKKKTGEYFNAYLDKVRIQKAKELLARGMKVYEAAERVGYANANNFYEKFKKLEGRCPSEYRHKPY
ncbi:response regulator transcription factor [Paenibacillus macerans]|uniref:Helix-turn-helix domain protein n=2 Tax=Paenibacillus macerans TaxID=44252 RepID=A0A091A1H6_PAEMA|nr:response regulator transcription factor [Paenibacillus macerans]KFN10141.1 helix-turn-helix domain protein [Paenibacillus macerans]MCY7558654.1 response regulator transcription factor [Paenibacillus macerans]SUA82108.1 chemotaxis protein CheY [Paenibacillus macerans]